LRIRAPILRAAPTIAAAALFLAACSGPRPDLGFPGYVVTGTRTVNESRGIVLTPDGEHLYLTHCSSSGYLYYMRTSDLSVEDSMFIAGSPYGATLTPNGEYLYLACSNGEGIAVLRTSDDSLRGVIPLGDQPYRVLASPDGKYVYVGYGGDPVTVIRTDSNCVVDSVDVRGGNWGMDFSPDGQFLYVCSEYDNSLAIVHRFKHSVFARIGSLQGAYDAVAMPDGRYVYVSCPGLDCVACVDIAERRIVAYIPLQGAPYSLAGLPDGKYVYAAVAADGANGIAVIRTSDNTVVHRIAIDGWPTCMAVTSTGDRVYVVTYPNELLVIGY
jgi:DNA-binding beta-propeller fold protein YncE